MCERRLYAPAWVIGAMGNKHFSQVSGPLSSREVQRRIAVVVLGTGVGAVGKEKPDQIPVVLVDGVVQGSIITVVPDIKCVDVRAAGK